MPVEIAQLKTELTLDPKTLGYAPMIAAGETRKLAERLNEIGASGDVVEVEFVEAYRAQAAVLGTEFVSLSDVKQRGWQCILAAQTVDGMIPIREPNIRLQVAEIWGPSTTTRANLLALQTRPCSRAEALFGEGVAVMNHDVAQALAS